MNDFFTMTRFVRKGKIVNDRKNFALINFSSEPETRKCIDYLHIHRIRLDILHIHRILKEFQTIVMNSREK